MLLKSPIEEKIVWTTHSKEKLRQYRFSPKRVMRIYRKPDRREVGIAPKTVAAMQIVGTKKNPTEAWMMYSIIKQTLAGKKKVRIIRVISCWRYPGRTPIHERPIIPLDTLEQINLISN